MMNIRKYSIILFLLIWPISIYAQQLTQFEYWFDDNYASRIGMSVASVSETIINKEINTNQLLPGMHCLHIRLRNSDGSYSGISSSYFFKMGGSGLRTGKVEYWFDNEYEHRQVIALGNTQDITIITDLPTESLPEGLHMLHMRVENTDGSLSSISSDYFFRGGNIGQQNSQLEYWYNDDFDNRKSTILGSGEDITLDAVFATDELSSGLHKFSMRTNIPGQSCSAIYSGFILKTGYGNISGFEYWFDDDYKNKRIITSQNTAKHILITTDIDASNLSNGLHRINYRASSEGNNFSSIKTDYFLKGINLTGNTATENANVVSWKYWFDDDITNSVEKEVTNPAQTIDITDILSAQALEYNKKHLLNLEFKNSAGSWSETNSTIFNKAVDIANCQINTLYPDINPSVYQVENLATIHRYFKITDEAGKAVPGMKIEYTVNNINKVFSSTISDTTGIVDVNFRIWGEDAFDTSDDLIPAYSMREIKFKRLCDTSGTEKKVTRNAFHPVAIGVYPYDSDTRTFGFEAGMNLGGEVELAHIASELGISNRITLSNLYENDVHKGISFSSKSKAGISADFSYSKEVAAFPSLSFEGNASIGTEIEYNQTLKENLSFGYMSYLKIAYNVLYMLYRSTGYIEPETHYALHAIGSYLGTNDKASTSIQNSTSFALTGGLEASAKSKYKENALGIKANAKGHCAFEFGEENKFTGSKNEMLNTQTAGAELEGSIGLGINFKTGTETFGGSMSATLTSAIGLERQSIAGTKILKKGSISKESKMQTDLGFFKGSKFGDGVSLEYSGKLGASFAKKYAYSLDLEKPVLDLIQASEMNNDPVLGFLAGKKSNYEVNFGSTFFNHMENIENYLMKYDSVPGNSPSDVVWSSQKTYTCKLPHSLSLKAKVWKLIDIDLEYKLGIFLESKYPLKEEIYHFPSKKTYPIVEYEDINSLLYYFFPVNYIDDIWKETTQALSTWGGAIKAKAAEEFAGMISALIEEDARRFSNKERKYSTNLRSYTQLRSCQQTDFSVLEFDIPGENKAFVSGTQIDFDFYYPAGEVLGSTLEKDTFAIISDIFFLQAYYLGDTLSVSPSGNFNIKSTVGTDDLDFLDIQPGTEVSLYYKAIGEKAWKNLGKAGESISTNKLGVYALGIGLNSDHQAPVIEIVKNENSNLLQVSITDNLGINWKSTYILVNGLPIAYEKSGGKLLVNLTESEVAEDLYVTVYAEDLAKNATTKTEIFAGNTSINQSKKTGKAYIYPNPASTYCYLSVPSDIITKQVQYAIVDIKGKVITKGNIENAETSLDISSFSGGVYFVVVFDHSNIISNSKLIVK